MGHVASGARLLKTTLAAGLALSLLGCAGAGNDAEDQLGAAPVSEVGECGDIWAEVRAQAQQEGLRDGEARRRADQARLACEVERLPQAARPEDASCPSVGERLTALAYVPRQPATLHVYVSCESESTALGFPIYAVERGDAHQGEVSTVESAIRTYLEGPTEEERRAGYGTAVVEPRWVADVGMRDDVAIIDFSADLSSSSPLGASAFNDRLIAELSATALQFASGVQFAIEGSCERFAEVVSGVPVCQPPVTRDRPAGTIGAMQG